MNHDPILCGKCGEPCDHVCGTEGRFEAMYQALSDLFDTLDVCVQCESVATHRLEDYDLTAPLCDTHGREVMRTEQLQTMRLVAMGVPAREGFGGRPEYEKTRELPHAAVIRRVAELLDRYEETDDHGESDDHDHADP